MFHLNILLFSFYKEFWGFSNSFFDMKIFSILSNIFDYELFYFSIFIKTFLIEFVLSWVFCNKKLLGSYVLIVEYIFYTEWFLESKPLYISLYSFNLLLFFKLLIESYWEPIRRKWNLFI